MKTILIFSVLVFHSQFLSAQDNDLSKFSLGEKQPDALITFKNATNSKSTLSPGLQVPTNFRAEKNTAGSEGNTNISPYKTSLLKDGLAIAGAVGVTLLGYTLIENKNDLTMAELAMKTKDKLPFFDKFVAGNYSDQANKDSYILFDASYAMPFVAALIDKKMRSHFGQIAVLYAEAIAITGSLYTLTAGLVYRSRPFVYGNNAPLDKRLDKGGQRSFYGGHVASTATSTFFIAKVFQDFHPGSKVTPYLYGASGALTALMAYTRLQSGYHFLSDSFISAIMGTASGILIPQFHKNESLKNISLSPEIFPNGANGFSLSYRF